MKALDKISESYKKFKKENKELKLAADLTPVVGSVLSGVDAAEDAYDGNYVGALANAAGMIPGIKHGVVLSKAAKAVQVAKANNAARAAGRVVDAAGDAGEFDTARREGYAKGGRVTGYKGYGKARKV